MKERDTHTYTDKHTHTSGTFVPRFLPGRAGERNRKSLRGAGSPGLELPGSLGSCDGDEFRVAVAVPLPALLYVRLSPGKAPPGVSAPRGPGGRSSAASPRVVAAGGEGNPVPTSRTCPAPCTPRPAGPGCDRARSSARRLQPNVDTRQKQLAAWCSLVLSFCRLHKQSSMTVMEAQESPLFNNVKLQRILIPHPGLSRAPPLCPTHAHT